MKVQAIAKLRHLRMAPRKVRLVVDLIRGMKVEEAMVQLSRLNKLAVRPVKKLLDSAVANAKNNHKIKEETLMIKTAFVDGGATLHRWMPRAMGRATPIRKRTSHITLILEGEAEENKKVKKVEKKLIEKKNKELKIETVKEDKTKKSKDKIIKKEKKDKSKIDKK